jgi:hypothetical protein
VRGRRLITASYSIPDRCGQRRNVPIQPVVHGENSELLELFKTSEYFLVLDFLCFIAHDRRAEKSRKKAFK